MPELKTGRRDDLLHVVSWIRSERDCRLWSGGRLPYPIDLATLEDAIGFTSAPSWFLMEGAVVLGFGQMIPKARGRIHLARIIVSPDHRGQGLGNFLVAGLLDLAANSQPASISLNVEHTNTPALSIYRKFGFVPADLPPDEPASQSLFMLRRALPALGD